MGRREKKARAKSDNYSEDEAPNKSENTTKAKNSVKAAVSSDDEEANEDLSLKIVQKSISRVVTHVEGAGEDSVGVTGGDDIVINDVSVSEVVKKKVKKVRKKKQKKSKDKAENDDENTPKVVLAEEKTLEETLNDAEGDLAEKVAGTDVIDNTSSENTVMRKLLRGPRYFDPPDKSWGACYNCGEAGHTAFNCTVAKKKRPCFICGSLEHEAKQCQKGKDCFICKGGGHRAKDCPNRFKRCSRASEVCLKCGASAHSMGGCHNDYSPDDLKEMQCYVCNKVGHLCCENYAGALPSEVSCYKCGHSGHYGQECGRPLEDTSTAGTPSSCYKCGEEGHFARECMTSTKPKKRSRDLSTPTGKHQKDGKGHKGAKSVPQDFGKAHKKKNSQYDNETPDFHSKSKRRGGWIMDDPGDVPHNNGWRSPSTPNKKHKIYDLTASNQGSNSHSYRRQSRYASGTSNQQGYSYASPYPHTPSPQGYSYAAPYPHTPSPQGYSYAQPYPHRYSASRFGNSSADGTRRNYDRW